MMMRRRADQNQQPDEDGSAAPSASKGKLDRVVGLVIVGLVTAAAALLWLAVAVNGPDTTIAESNDVVIGV